MELTNAQIEQKINQLPENIRNAIKEFDWSGEVMSIGNNYNLQIDELEIFRKRTLEIIVGLAPAARYESILKKELNISDADGTDIVLEANERIFRELQKRAFILEPEEKTPETASYDSSDPYHEPIGHDDIRSDMRDEGVELLDHDEPLLQNNSVIASTTTPSVIARNEAISDNKPEIASQARNDTISSYQEPIEEKDLRGVTQQSADTSILKTLNQSNPDNVLKNPDVLNAGDAKDELKNTLDKKLFTETHVPEGDVIDLSPSESDEISENGTFLNHLSENLSLGEKE